MSDRFDRMAFLKKISDHFLIKCDQKINPLLERHRKNVLGEKWLSWTNLQIVWSRIWIFWFFTHGFLKIGLRDFNFSKKSQYWPFFKPNWTHIWLARVKTSLPWPPAWKKLFFLLNYLYFWNFVTHFFQWWVADFSKVENSKFVNMHYTFFGTSWKISQACKIILLDRSLNCMQQKFDFLIFTHGFLKISLRDFNFL